MHGHVGWYKALCCGSGNGTEYEVCVKGRGGAPMTPAFAP
jgi:hypothetical protein